MWPELTSDKKTSESNEDINCIYVISHLHMLPCTNLFICFRLKETVVTLGKKLMILTQLTCCTMNLSFTFM